MLYTILIRASEGVFEHLLPEEQTAVLAKHGAPRDALAAAGKLGPFAANLLAVQEGEVAAPNSPIGM